MELLEDFEVFLGDVGLLDEVFFDYWDIVSEESSKNGQRLTARLPSRLLCRAYWTAHREHALADLGEDVPAHALSA